MIVLYTIIMIIIISFTDSAPSSPSEGEWSIVKNVSVCLSVAVPVPVCEHILETTHPN